MQYLHLLPSGRLPRLCISDAFRTVLIIEALLQPSFRESVCRWLIDGGCRYLMAWGQGCADWPEAMQQANQAAFEAEEIPSDILVIATCHPDETLTETFWFARHTAMHPCHALEEILLLHVSPVAREAQVSRLYRDARVFSS